MIRRTAILGTGALARHVANELACGRHRRYRLIGTIGEDLDALANDFPCPCLGRVSDLQTIVNEQRVQRVILAPDDKYKYIPTDRLVEAQASQRLTIETGSDVLEKLTGKFPIESFLGSYALFSDTFRVRPVNAALCRLISLVIAVPCLLLCLPLMALIAPAIRLDSPGPVLFIQERIGYGGRRFRLLKFRSMLIATEQRSEWIRDNVDKITRVGHWIRKFRMDELPQFINVIRGDMNIVGPRPHPSSNRELFTLVARNMPFSGQQTPYYSIRQSVRPGITGWAQVRYKYANGLDEEIEKLQYDLYYIKHCSALLDIGILFRTLKVVLLGHTDDQVPAPLFSSAPNVRSERPSLAAAPENLTSSSHAAPDSYGRITGTEQAVIRKMRNEGDRHAG